jgi:uncharacterized membrane protein
VFNKIGLDKFVFVNVKGDNVVEKFNDWLTELLEKICTEFIERVFVNKSVTIESSSKLINSVSDRNKIKSLKKPDSCCVFTESVEIDVKLFII